MSTAFNPIIPEQGIEDVIKQSFNNINPGEVGPKMKSKKTTRKNRKQLSIVSFFVTLMFFGLFTTNSFAASPQMVNLQAQLVKPSGIPYVSTSVDVHLDIYDSGPSGTGAVVWTETQYGVMTDADGLIDLKMGFVNPLTPSVFTGVMRYLEITINTDPPMSPRSRLVSVPYSLYSSMVSSVDGAAGGLIEGVLSVRDSLLVQENARVYDTVFAGALQIADGAYDGYIMTCDASGNAYWAEIPSATGAYWSLTGNAGTSGGVNFMGTTDDHPVTFRVADRRVMRYKQIGDDGTLGDECPSIIGGYEGNSVADAADGAFIGGGGYNDIFSGDMSNQVNDDFGVVAGGANNRTSANYATIGGGKLNRSSGTYSTIPGGYDNTASGQSAFAAGALNRASGDYSVAIGEDCVASGEHSYAFGRNAHAVHNNSFVFADKDVPQYSTGDNTFKVQSYDGIFLVSETGVGINCSETGSFTLAVDGKIGAREIVVTATDPWPDYVFDEDYDLMPLDELEQSLLENKHLPGIPSAATVAEEGVSVGNMQARMLEKIEELTLYMIELKKENDDLKNRIEEIAGN